MSVHSELGRQEALNIRVAVAWIAGCSGVTLSVSCRDTRSRRQRRSSPEKDEPDTTKDDDRQENAYNQDPEDGRPRLSLTRFRGRLDNLSILLRRHWIVFRLLRLNLQRRLGGRNPSAGFSGNLFGYDCTVYLRCIRFLLPEHKVEDSAEHQGCREESAIIGV
jgi:hypothetical protein